MTARSLRAGFASGFSLTVALIVAVGGGLILLGWLFGLAALTNLGARLAEMTVNCAVGLLLAGVALAFLRREPPALWQRVTGLTGAVAVFLLGALTLAENYFGSSFGLEQILPGGAGRARMAAGVAVNFVLLGLALFFLGLERIWTSQAFSFAAGLIALSTLTRVAFDLVETSPLRPGSSLAIYLGASVLLLAAGLQCARLRQGWMATMRSDRAGGRMARRMFVAAAAVPVVLGFLRMLWQDSGGFGSEVGAALFSVTSTGLFTWLVWFNARTLNVVQEKVLHRERLYLVLSQCNQSIVHIGERDPLFARVCQIAVEFGGFRMAWIGLADRTAHRVKPVACAGFDDGFLDGVVFSLRDEPAGQMPAAVAVREGRSVICNRVDSDPRMATLRTEALERGYRSAAAFPLRNNGDIIGCYVLYMGEPDFFDADEVKLLEEVAGDISFALRQMENEASRRRMEAEKSRLGAELNTIFDSVPAMIFYKDREHRLVRANAASLRAFGRPAEEIFGKTDAELGLPHAEQYAHDEDEIAATGEAKLNYVEPFETPTGTRWFLTDKVPLRDESGAVSGVIGLALDITEQKRAEEALRQSEADFRASFRSTAVGQVQADPVTGRYLRVNPKFCEITGYSEEELLQMTFRELTHPDDRTDDGAAHVQLVSGEVSELVREKRYRRRDGSTVWVSINASIIRDAEGRPQRTLAAMHDITARKAAEEAVRATEAKYRILVEQAIVGIYIIQGERYVYANPKMIAALGYTFEELTTRPVVEFVFEEDRPTVTENIRRRLAGEIDSVRYDLRMLRKNGTVMHIDACGSRADYNGKPAIIGTFLDVTEQRKLEEQLLQSQKMDAIGQLAGGIAHDFNNLLTAITGNTRLALYDLPEDHPAREALSEIDIASMRATDLVRRILTFSRQETPERKPVRLQPIVEEALKLLRSTLPATVEIRSRFAGAPATVLADTTQVQQVIMNLGTNANHAMKGRGVLELGLTNIDVDAAQARLSPELREGRYVQVSVSDSGCGMDRATLARIFEPFFTTKPQGEGTGLGLSVVHGIMKSHDGAITAYSHPGKGTIFHLYFPVATKTIMPEPESAKVQPPTRGSGQRILFVDDEDLITHLAEEMFTRLGYRVSVFTRAEQALATFRAAPQYFDIVVSDLSMPGMTGPDLAKEILRIRPDIPVVIATGYIRPQDTEMVRGIGIRALMLKPNTVEEMAPAIHRLLTETTAAAIPADPPVLT